MDASQTTLPPAYVAPGQRRRASEATIPEQIANRLAAEIVNGAYRDWERLREL